MDALVFDTSALLNFGHRGELAAVLKKLSVEYKLFTTPAAQAELTDPDRKQYYATFLGEYFTVQAASAVHFDLTTLGRLASTIDAADITVMTIAHELNGIAVLDDKAARQEAKLLDLRLMGTLGLLHLALQRKWLPDADCMACVIRMCRAKFFIPPPTVGQTFAVYFATIE